jgi:ribosomal protein S12 methylthiotransferase
MFQHQFGIGCVATIVARALIFRTIAYSSSAVPTPRAAQKTRPKPASQTAPAVSFVSLGCPKALVDSERIITRLRAEGYELSREHKGADLVIVNTCGFLDSAQAESLDAIGQALAENGKVIVTGCMGAEPEKITAKFPNVLAVTGPQQIATVKIERADRYDLHGTVVGF